jgi:hypothetical protein
VLRIPERAETNLLTAMVRLREKFAVLNLDTKVASVMTIVAMELCVLPFSGTESVCFKEGVDWKREDQHISWKIGWIGGR